MLRMPIVVVSLVLLGALACQSPVDTGKQANTKAQAKAPPQKVEPPPAPKAEPPAPPVEPPPIEPPPVEPPLADAPPTDGAPTDESAPADPNATWKPPPGADIRSDAVIPPGTPTANAEAFKALPTAKGDGPPV